MNRYAELRRRQQEEFNRLPFGFAFSDKQFKEMIPFLFELMEEK